MARINNLFYSFHFMFWRFLGICIALIVFVLFFLGCCFDSCSIDDFMFWRFLGICTCSNSICFIFFWVVAFILVLLMDPLFYLIRSL